MAAKLRMLVPEGTTNYVKNPSAEVDTSGWNVTAGIAVDIFEDDFERPDGPPLNGWLQSGAWSIVGGKLVMNNPTLGSELLTDGEVEIWSSSTDLTNWSEIVAGSSTVNQESTIKHGGAYSARLDVDASTGFTGIYQASTIPKDAWILCDFWARASASGKIGRVSLGTYIYDVSLTTDWVNYKVSLRAPSANQNITWNRGAPSASSSLYFDDLSAKVVSVDDTVAVRDVSLTDVKIKVSASRIAGTQVGCVGWVDDYSTPSNFIIAYLDGSGRIVVDKCVAGTYTNILAATAVTYVAGALIELWGYRSGADLKIQARYNGANVGAELTVSDAGIVDNTQHGAFSTYENEIDRIIIETWEEVDPTSSVARSQEEARFGFSSLKVTTVGDTLNEGIYYRITDFVNNEGVKTGSAYVRGEGTVRARLIDSADGEWISDPLELVADRWQRVEVTGRSYGSNDFRLYIETAEDLPQAVTFYVDGVQIEAQEEATTYCDGDQAGCRWSLLEHGSISIRDPYTREGGRWVEIAGPSCEEQDLYMTVIGGAGVAPIQNQIQPYADAPGAYFQNTKVLSRPMTLSFHAKTKRHPRTNKLPSLKALHKLKQQLLDVVKPDRTAGAQALRLEYIDGEIPLYMNVRYDGGMEGEWDVRNQFVNSFPMRLLATSPFFVEDNQEVSALNFRNTQTINYALQRVDGEWSDMNGGFDGQVLAFTVGSRGEIIAVGNFIHANHKAGAVDEDIFANFAAWWDGTKWNAYGVGANNIIRGVAQGPNGWIYFVGDFTEIGGVLANYVAYMDTSGVFHALGTGLNGPGYTVAVGPDNRAFIGGNFTSADGIAAYYVVSYLNGTFKVLGANSGLNNVVYSLSISQDGTEVAIGGEFTDESGDPGILDLNYVALYVPSTVQFYALGVGFDAAVHKVLFTPSSRIYAVGDFVQSNDTALVLLYIAYWNGASWFPVGIGADNTTRDLDISALGQIVFGGDFERVGGTDALYAALWNLSAYVNMDVELADPVYAVTFDKQENIFMAPNGTTAEFAAITTVNNIGSAETNPKVHITGPCTVRWIENQTTKKRVYIDLDISEDENIIIDFSQGTVISNVQGNLAYAIDPGSDLRAWTLIPGNNKIAILMVDDVAATAYISYVPRHWSADATAIVEDL